MDILWHPEEGHCSWCAARATVRGFSTGRRFSMMCYRCWDAQQDGMLVGGVEWREDVALVFHVRGQREPSIGAAQGSAFN